MGQEESSFHKALSVVPILPSEISPLAFGSTFAGVAASVGQRGFFNNRQDRDQSVSLFDSSIILARPLRSIAGGEHIRTTVRGQKTLENAPSYSLFQGTFAGPTAAYVIVLALLGLETRGCHFERRNDSSRPIPRRRTLALFWRKQEGSKTGRVKYGGRRE